MPINANSTDQEQIAQLGANALAIKAKARRECARIDRAHEFSNSLRSSVGAHVDVKNKLTSAQREARERKTPHELIADNPVWLAAYKRNGIMGLLGL